MSDPNFDEKIKEMSRQRGISRRQLCKKIGMTENGLSNSLKSGKIKIDVLIKIADILEVPMEYFFPNPSSEREKRIYELEKIVNSSVPIDALQELEEEILKNIIKGKGLIYLNYDSTRGRFDTKYSDLKKIPTKKELGSIAMEKVFGRTLDEIERDAKPRIDDN